MLMIDAAPVAATQIEINAREKIDISVLRASAEELAAHDAQLAEIDKASGGKCLWKSV